MATPSLLSAVHAESSLPSASSAELLEGALRQGEQSFFPELSEDVRILVDIINHERTQAYIRSKFDNFNRTTRPDIEKLYNDVENATSVFGMLKSLKTLLNVLTNCVHPSSMFSQIYNGLLSGIFDELDFLQKSLSESERVDKFIRYIDGGVSNSVSKAERDAAFEEYLRQWRENNQPSFRTNKGFSRDLNKEIQVMRREYEEAMEGTEYVKVTTIRSIEQYFEPLREKLLSAREEHSDAMLATAEYAGTAVLFIQKLFPGNASRLEISTDAKRVREKGWYDRISKYLIKYLTDPDSTDWDMIRIITEENLEKDIHHFRDCIRPWLNEARSALDHLPRKSFSLPKELIMKEMKRMSKFFYALILNDPAMLREHQELLDELIRDATEISTEHLAPNVSLMPLISFGQLPLAGGLKDRVVRLKFVVDSSVSHERIREVLQEIKAICKHVWNSENVEETNGVRVISLDIRIEDNVPRYIGGLISRLADLHIRAVLVGEYGMGIGGQPSSGGSVLRHAMNPQFNRIYSVNAADKAENFMPTYYRGSLDRGGEPYFCPNGWRRYSIDVGMSASEFERKYGDWPVAYHGTKGHLANKILMTGMKASGESLEVRCPNLPEGGGAIFLSPSIEYSGHPYYANVWKVKNKYVQMVLQVRVDRKRVFERIEGTLDGAFASDPPLDPNFEDNSEMEWMVKWPPFTQMSAMDGLLVYGIMLRVTDEHPGWLPQNKWWEKGRPGVWNFF